MKLLIHELQTMNISVKLITEDNINNLMSISKLNEKDNLPRRKNIDLPENSIRKSIINQDFDLSDNIKNKGENIEFNEEDIVRSELVKEYILSKLKNGIHT